MINSVNNYNGYLEYLHNYFSKYGLSNANKFLEHIKQRYNKHKRVFLDKKFMWLLYDDYCLVKSSGIRWYAVVGTGGTGKTTLAKNIGYFFDNSFNVERLCFDSDEFVENLKTFPAQDAMKAICLDEPDQDIHPLSKKGRKLKDILGKARNQKIFCIFNATDMYDVPDYIYKKINGIFFCNKKGSAIFYRDQPNNNVYIVSKLKILYKQHGYKCFYFPEFKKFGVKGETRKETPLPEAQEKEYMKKKVKDYQDTLKEYSPPKKKEQPTDNRNKEIVKLRNKGEPYKKIAEKFGISHLVAANIYHRHKKKYS